MALFRENADLSVRPATPEDDAPITRVQLRAWRSGYADVLGAATVDSVDVAAVRSSWAAAIATPPSPGHRVLVACDGPRVVGVAASIPVDDGIEVITMEVDPDHRRTGHGSRLLTACVDLGREDGAAHVRTWVVAEDEVRRRFLAGAGLGPDGAARELAGPDGVTITERRWSAEL